MKPRPTTRPQIERLYDQAVRGLRFGDVHVHDMPDCCGQELALVGPNILIDYHYVTGEVQSGLNMQKSDADRLWALPQQERVDYLVTQLFGNGCLPVSEASLGILTAAFALGLPVESGDMHRVLREWRAMFGDLGRKKYTDLIFKLSGINWVVSTQSPFVPKEFGKYLSDVDYSSPDLTLEMCAMHAESLLRACTKAYLATMITSDRSVHRQNAATLAKFMEQDPLGKHAAGIHLEAFFWPSGYGVLLWLEM